MMLPLVAFAACGGGEAGGMAMEMEAAPAPEPVVEQSGPPRIFFVAPEDGASCRPTSTWSSSSGPELPEFSDPR